MFKEGFSGLEENLNKRYYTSVGLFSEHFSSVINAALRVTTADELKESDAHANGGSSAKDAMPDYKYRKALVTRIVKAVKTPFEDALRKESELCQKPFEKELANLDKLLNSSLRSRHDSLSASRPRGGEHGSAQSISVRGARSRDQQLNGTAHEDPIIDGDVNPPLMSIEDSMAKHQRPTPDSMPNSNGITGGTVNGFGSASSHSSDDVPDTEPLTPPISSAGDPETFSHGGIPWYMEPFDPVGTTVQEERWTGRELVRGMSEELSDMDEEQLSGLVEAEGTEAMPDSVHDIEAELAAKAKAKKRKIANARRRRPWG